MLSVCKLRGVSKSYSGKNIINNLDLDIYDGEMIAIVGKSGAGKTTLLNILGLLEKVDKGSIELFNKDVTKIKYRELNKLLRNKISYLFQNYALIDNETVGQNLDIALTYSKKNKAEKRIEKENALKKVGLEIDLKKKVFELSGGEQQRLAIARILLKPSSLILADEPTGSLDRNTRDEILDILKDINSRGITMIIVTHDEVVASKCSRVINL